MLRIARTAPSSPGSTSSASSTTNSRVYTKVFDMPEKPDVIIDFSHPSALPDLLSYGKMNNVPLVLATTGYTDEERAQITAASAQVPVFFTFNMSLGINLLVELARKATQILGGQFDIEIVEKHHNQKKDAPSGTAIMIAEAINEELGGQGSFRIQTGHSVRKPRDKDEIGMHAIRGGTIVGRARHNFRRTRRGDHTVAFGTVERGFRKRSGQRRSIPCGQACWNVRNV